VIRLIAKLEVGEILRGVLDWSGFSYYQRKVLWALRDCRTAALGGHVDACDSCGSIKISYNSCRNRHCPKCQGVEKEMWMLGREEDLLPITYFHVVFTLPSELNDLCRYNPETMYTLLFESAKQTLEQFGLDKRWLGAQVGMTMILHTWGQSLVLHPHVHVIVPNGGLNKDGTWQFPKKGNEKFLFPVKAMQSVYKALFMKRLHELIQSHEGGSMILPTDVPTHKADYKIWKEALYQKNWVIYAKRPFGGPQQVIEYLGRYSHKVAISNHRIKAVTTEGVTFSYKDYKNGGKTEEMTLTTTEFVRRFAQHIVPPKFRRMRHYGFLSNAAKGKALAKARISLKVKAEEKRDKAARRAAAKQRLFGSNPNQCRCCKVGTMVTVGVILPARAPPVVGLELTNVVWIEQ
jgi:Putative transposase/Transposase zinc-binding domain